MPGTSGVSVPAPALMFAALVAGRDRSDQLKVTMALATQLSTGEAVWLLNVVCVPTTPLDRLVESMVVIAGPQGPVGTEMVEAAELSPEARSVATTLQTNVPARSTAKVRALVPSKAVAG